MPVVGAQIEQDFAAPQSDHSGGTRRVDLPAQPRRQPSPGVASRPHRASLVVRRRRAQLGRRLGARPAAEFAQSDRLRASGLRSVGLSRQRPVRHLRRHRLGAVSCRLVMYDSPSFLACLL